MEGNLSKWVGYLSGWSEKYFVLHSGTFSVYASQDEKDKGTPAMDHLNMGVCEIVVYANDALQWELRVTMESKVWYLRALTTATRQKWIKALGSAKACLLDTSSLEYLPTLANNFVPSVVLSHLVLEEDTTSCSIGGASMDALFDLTASNNFDETNSEHENGSMNNLLLSSTNQEDSDDDVRHSALLAKCNSAKSSITLLENFLARPSEVHLKEGKNVIEDTEAATRDLLEAINGYKIEIVNCSRKGNITSPIKKTLDVDKEKVVEKMKSSEDSKTIKKYYVTFFTACDVSFQDVATKIITTVDDRQMIPIDAFTNACQYYVGFFERFAGTVLTPLRVDIQENIVKIRRACSNHPEHLTYLQELVDYEVLKKQHTGANTGTQALLWLSRSLRVMSCFLENCLNSSSETWKDTSASLWKSYNAYLAENHNWMVQRLFKVGLKLLPDFHSFCTSMAINPTPADVEDLYSLIIRDGLQYSREMSVIVSHLIDLFALHKMKV